MSIRRTSSKQNAVFMSQFQPKENPEELRKSLPKLVETNPQRSVSVRYCSASQCTCDQKQLDQEIQSVHCMRSSWYHNNMVKLKLNTLGHQMEELTCWRITHAGEYWKQDRRVMRGRECLMWHHWPWLSLERTPGSWHDRGPSAGIMAKECQTPLSKLNWWKQFMPRSIVCNNRAISQQFFKPKTLVDALSRGRVEVQITGNRNCERTQMCWT